jgi:molecular chaperone HscC
MRGWTLAILLVGGASRIPCVARLFEELTQRPGLHTLNPDQAVALGAAIQGALKAQDTAVEDLVVTDIAPFTLGIRTRAEFGGRHVDDVFTPILERGTVVPASRVERFTTAGHGQSQIRIQAFQGEHSICALNTALGEYVFAAIPPGTPGAEAIDVRFTYDLNGLLDVDVTLVSTGRTESFYIVGRPGALTPAQIDEAREALGRFKIHPREALPNATAIARAEAAFVELTGDRRIVLGRALAAFRAALDGQDPRLIDEARKVLVALTRQLRDR